MEEASHASHGEQQRVPSLSSHSKAYACQSQPVKRSAAHSPSTTKKNRGTCPTIFSMLGKFIIEWRKASLLYSGAHGVVVSHPLRMRKALGSIPSVSMHRDTLSGWANAPPHSQECPQERRSCPFRSRRRGDFEVQFFTKMTAGKSPRFF